MYSFWLAVKALTTVLLAAASVVVLITVLSNAPNTGPESAGPLAAASQTATQAPYPLPGVTKAPPQSPATPTRAAYPLPATPTSRPTVATPGSTITATPAIVRPATATPTPRFGPILAPSGPPYTVYLPLIMKAPSFGCAPDTNGMGLERYATYQSFALTERMSLFVNTCNGNLVVQYSEFSMPSRGLPLTLFHTYNTHSGVWTHSLGIYLAFDETGSAIWHDADGSEVLYLYNNGSFSPPAGTFDHLVQNVDLSYTLTHTDQSTHQFDSSGLLTQVRDRHGNVIGLSYTNGLLSQAQAAGGQTLTFNYTNSSLSSVSDAAGHTVQLGYTGSSLTSFADPLTYATVLSYNTNLVTSITDPRNVQTTLTYDANNRVQSITLGGTQIASFAYGISSTIFTDGDTHALTYTLNSTGQVTRSVDALGGVTAMGFDANYNVTQRTDALGHSSRAGYDASGNVLTRTDALNQLTTYTYNTTNDLLSMAAPLNHTTRYGYDAAGNLTVITDALGYLTTYGYDSFGQRTNFTDANGNPTAYAYNSAGYVVTTTDALSNKTVYSYDPVGNRIGLTDARGNVITFGYDAANRLIATTAPLTVGVTALTQYGYDTVGNQTVITDARGYTTTFAYDALNRQTAVTDALNHSTQSQYDAAGNRLVQTDTNGNSTRYGYDALNRTLVITDALTNLTFNQVDLLGNRTVITDARGSATSFAYDVLNHLTSTTAPLTGTQTALTQYQYDAVSNRTVITDANSNTTSFSYDLDNRQLSVTDALNNSTFYRYDRVGNRLVVTDTGSFPTTFAYDALNRVITTTNAAGKAQSVSYDAVGNRASATDELTRTTQYVYDAAHRLVAMTDPLLQTTAYAYDKTGNLTRLSGPKTGGITVTFDITYTYDAVSRPTAKQTLIGTTGYAYDNVGNRIVLTDTSGAFSLFAFDGLNRMIRHEDHAIGGSLNVSYTLGYDPNGNQTSDIEYRTGQAFATASSYNKANWPVTNSDPSGNLTAYAYDAVGNRTSTTDPLGVSTVITPNQVNLPIQTTHTQNGNLLDTTTTSFDARRFAQQSSTYSGTLPLTNTYAYNGVKYLTSLALRNYAVNYGGNNSFTYTIAYRADNLVALVDPGYILGSIEVYYDLSKRVRCYDDGNQSGVATRAWSYYPDGNRQYAYDSGTGGLHWRCPAADDQTDPGPYITASRERYTYSGQKLTLREWQPYTVDNPSVVNAVSSYSYDSSGNLTKEVHVDNQAQTTTTGSYNWSWQAAANRLSTLTSTNGITTAISYDRLGRVIRRTTALGHSDYVYEDGTDWLVRETWQITTSGPIYDLARYYYVNGAPARVDYAVDVNDPATGYKTIEVQYDWDGGAIVGLDSGGTSYGGVSGLGKPITPGAYDPWGNVVLPNSPVTWRNYRWHAAHGYLWFADLSLYYIHGRWWSPETGRFISPNERGDYLFGGDGPCVEDPVNCAWKSVGSAAKAVVDLDMNLAIDVSTRVGKTSPYARDAILFGWGFYADTAMAANQAFYPPSEWTLADRIGNNTRATLPVVTLEGIMLAPLYFAQGATTCVINDCTNKARAAEDALTNNRSVFESAVTQVGNVGYRSFDAFKRAMGSAGDGNVWHHIVEQRTANVVRFGAAAIHNAINVLKVSREANQAIADYYSRIRPFTDGMTVREWLTSQSLADQFEFGQKILQMVQNGEVLP